MRLGGFKYYYTYTVDENTKIHRKWLNRDGTVFRSSVDGDFESRTWRSVLGKPTRILSPRAGESLSSPFKTTIDYSADHVERSRGETDQNTTKTVYDQNLRSVYLQEAADASQHDFWATTYDSLGRVVRVGKETGFSSTSWYKDYPVDHSTAYGSGADEWRKKYTYDTTEQGSYNHGRLTKVEGNWDTDNASEYWQQYRYSREGLVTRVQAAIVDSDTTETEYSYDTGGRLRKLSYQSSESAEKFFLWYEYDDAGRLTKIFSHTVDSKPSYPTAEYSYNTRNQVTIVKVRDGTSATVRQQIDYTYSARGFLIKINDPASLGSDRFAMQLGYAAKVSGGTSTGWSAQKNGNVSQMKWVNRKFSDTPWYYTFGYDARNQLTKADHSGNDYYDISSYTYDDNGNITLRDTRSYYYDGDEANTNRLDNTQGTYDDNWDYDASGRFTKDSWNYTDSVSYWFPGAAAHKFDSEYTNKWGTGDAYIKHLYDQNNQRVRKHYYYEVPNGDEPPPPPPSVSGPSVAEEASPVGYDTYNVVTDYVRDKAGRILAVYNDGDLVERYVWGPTGLISIVKGVNGSTTRYFTLTDHLGSVRTVTDSNGNAVAGYDYMPFGKWMRTSVSSGGDSRFKFGGKELDTEHSIYVYYFEARFYDPFNGRFGTPDILREGTTPYSYANNNPLCFVDPSGLSPGGIMRDESDYVTRNPEGFSDYGGSWWGWVRADALRIQEVTESLFGFDVAAYISAISTVGEGDTEILVPEEGPGGSIVWKPMPAKGLTQEQLDDREREVWVIHTNLVGKGAASLSKESQELVAYMDAVGEGRTKLKVYSIEQPATGVNGISGRTADGNQWAIGLVIGSGTKNGFPPQASEYYRNTYIGRNLVHEMSHIMYMTGYGAAPHSRKGTPRSGTSERDMLDWLRVVFDDMYPLGGACNDSIKLCICPYFRFGPFPL